MNSRLLPVSASTESWVWHSTHVSITGGIPPWASSDTWQRAQVPCRTTSRPFVTAAPLGTNVYTLLESLPKVELTQIAGGPYAHGSGRVPVEVGGRLSAKRYVYWPAPVFWVLPSVSEVVAPLSDRYRHWFPFALCKRRNPIAPSEDTIMKKVRLT